VWISEREEGKSMAEQLTVESNNEPVTERKHEGAERARRRAAAMWRSASSAVRTPAIGAGVAGVMVLAAGALWGVTEAALAGVAAWAVFRALAKRATKETSAAATAHASE
jgi:hypothetical protein